MNSHLNQVHVSHARQAEITELGRGPTAFCQKYLLRLDVLRGAKPASGRQIVLQLMKGQLGGLQPVWEVITITLITDHISTGSKFEKLVVKTTRVGRYLLTLHALPSCDTIGINFLLMLATPLDISAARHQA